MLVTAAEASKKWCPFARISKTTSEQSYNRVDVGLSVKSSVARSPCIADTCMCWRYLNPAEKIEIFVAGESDADFARRRDAAIAARMGYCGLAGKQSYE